MKIVLSNIKKCREDLGYSQEYMASVLEISQPAYSKIEAGKSELSLSHIITICRTLETDFNVLMKDDLNSDAKQLTVEQRLAHLESRLTFLETLLEEKISQRDEQLCSIGITFIAEVMGYNLGLQVFRMA